MTRSNAFRPDPAAFVSHPPVDAADRLSARPDVSVLVYPWKLVDDATLSHLTLNLTSSHPPAFLSQAEDDPVHMQNALFYFYGLQQAKALPSELHIYPRGGHGYGRCTVGASKSMLGIDEVCEWPARGATFLKTLLEPHSSKPAAVDK